MLFRYHLRFNCQVISARIYLERISIVSYSYCSLETLTGCLPVYLALERNKVDYFLLEIHPTFIREKNLWYTVTSHIVRRIPLIIYFLFFRIKIGWIGPVLDKAQEAGLFNNSSVLQPLSFLLNYSKINEDTQNKDSSQSKRLLGKTQGAGLLNTFTFN